MEVNRAYMVPLGLLKVLEFVCSLISWALLASWPTLGGIVELHFPMAMGIIAWILSILLLIANVLDLVKKLGANVHTILAIVHAVIGILLLAAGAWGADTLGRLGGKMAAGMAFAIITAIVLLGDAVAHVVIGKKIYGGETSTASVKAHDDEVSVEVKATEDVPSVEVKATEDTLGTE